MKINNTPPIALPSADDDKNNLTKTADTANSSVHTRLPEDTANPNRTGNSQAVKPQSQNLAPPLPPPIKLADYAATGSLHSFQKKLLNAAQKILASNTPEPAAMARKQVIDLVIKENFRTLLTRDERHEIIDTLSKVLNTDPLFCSEVDKMMQIAALKLNPNKHS